MEPDETTTIECRHCGERIASDAEACPACGDLRTNAACVNHSGRQAEGQCVICGNALCTSCNRGGDQHYLCESHREVPIMQGWAQVYTTSDDLEAELIRDNLVAEGVDARVLSQKDHFAVPVDFGDLSPVRVLVPAYDYSEAVQLIDAHTDSEGEVAFGDGTEEES